VLKPAPWGVVPKGEWTDHEDRLAAEWLQRQGILVSVDVAGQAVQTAARDHPFHPVRTYLNGLQWDGVERVDRWLSTYLGADDTEYSRAVGSRWLISAVARIFRPGAKADCCLILEGPQGIRKSTALRTIAGEYFTDELADLGSKDAAMQTRGVWIIELSELDNLSHAEVARIKAFMSRTTDRFRPPYGMRLVESPRQCVFAGTVNHGTYLRDETGGRRFWPVVCGCIDIDTLARDRDQLWAETKIRFVYWIIKLRHGKRGHFSSNGRKSARVVVEVQPGIPSEGLERLKSCDNVSKLARELKIPRRWLYLWRERARGTTEVVSAEDRERERKEAEVEGRFHQADFRGHSQ
jgi:predicted P-loop ATPase